jgi:phage gp36-like protein
MPFASRSDLLARSNARRLAQLAVPADMDMVPDAALRAAIAGDSLVDFSQAEQDALALALDAIDKALSDADALILSYAIPASVQTTLLSRLASTIALYYLQGAERMTDDVQKAFDAVIATLKAHSRGELDLIPQAADALPPSDDLVVINSRPKRYGTSWPLESWP